MVPAYDAFISYSHAKDRAVATALQRGLHTLGKPWYRMRALRVFRDDTSLSANPHLWAAIEQGLRDSRYFILMASPEAVASTWVRSEIAFWRRNHDPATFMIVVTDGRVAWDRDTGDFDWSRTTALPRQELSNWFPGEPLWVELQGVRGDTLLSLRNVVFRAAVCRLAAPLHGVPPDELDSTDIRQHRLASRLRRAAVTALSVLLVLATVLGLVAAQQRAVALGQRDRAEREATIALSRALAAEADVLAGRDPLLSVRVAVAAYRTSATPQAVAALMRTLDRHRHDIGFVEYNSGSTGTEADAFGEGIAGNALLSPDGRLLAVAARQTGEVRLRDIATNRLVDTFRSEFGFTGRPAIGIHFTADGSRLVTTHPNGVEVWDLASRTRVFSRDLTEVGQPWLVSPDGHKVGVTELDDHGRLVATHLVTTDRPDAEVQLVAEGPDAEAAMHAAVLGIPPVAGERSNSALALPTRRAATLSATSIVEVSDLDTGQRLASRQLPGSVGRWSTVAISDDGRTVMAGDDQGQLVAMDAGLEQTRTVGRLPGSMSSIHLSPDGSRAVAVDNAGNVLLLRPVVDSRFDVLPGTEGRTGPDGVEEPSLTTSPDSRWLLVHRPGKVELWRLDERRKVSEFGTDAEVHRIGLQPPVVAFDQDSTRFAIYANGRVTARELISQREVGTAQTGEDPAGIARAFLQLLDGGVYLISRDIGDRSEVVAVELGRERVVVRGNRVGLEGTPPGAVVAVVAPQGGTTEQPKHYEISVWSLTGQHAQEIGRLGPERETIGIYAITVAHDGRYVVIRTDRPEAELVEVLGGRHIPLLGGQGRGSLSEFGFVGGTGLILQHVVPDRDSEELRNRLLLWHGETGSLLGEWEEPLRLASPSDGDSYLVMAADGTALTVRANGGIAVWPISPDAWAAKLCALAGDLDATQRQRYLPEGQRQPICP